MVCKFPKLIILYSKPCDSEKHKVEVGRHYFSMLETSAFVATTV